MITNIGTTKVLAQSLTLNINPVTGVCVLPETTLKGCFSTGILMLDATGVIKSIAGSSLLLTDTATAAGCSLNQFVGLGAAITNNGFELLANCAQAGINISLFTIQTDTTLTFDLTQPYLPKQLLVFYVNYI